MRPSRSSLVTIALGLGVLGISLARISGVAHTAFALFLATVILVELFEDSDRERPVRAVLLTHGHEDHVGALPYLLREARVQEVWATRLTLGLRYRPGLGALGALIDRIHLRRSVQSAMERSAANLAKIAARELGSAATA